MKCSQGGEGGNRSVPEARQGGLFEGGPRWRTLAVRTLASRGSRVLGVGAFRWIEAASGE